MPPSRKREGKQQPQLFHLNAASPDARDLADRFDLRPRDVVFVDAVGVVRYSRVIFNILPTAQFLREPLDRSNTIDR